MRPKAFVVPFKETTIGGRSRAIILRGDQPLGCTEANMIRLTLPRTQYNLQILQKRTCTCCRKSLISTVLDGPVPELQADPHDSEL